ncbi:MAG: hypothetical protein ACOY0T_05195 [Myxococcota bacterium]
MTDELDRAARDLGARTSSRIRSRVPTGILKEERAAAILALCAACRTTEAQAAAKRFSCLRCRDSRTREALRGSHTPGRKRFASVVIAASEVMTNIPEYRDIYTVSPELD